MLNPLIQDTLAEAFGSRTNRPIEFDSPPTTVQNGPIEPEFV